MIFDMPMEGKLPNSEISNISSELAEINVFNVHVKTKFISFTEYKLWIFILHKQKRPLRKLYSVMQ